MGEDEVTIGMTVPLDSDGFLRRECPTCEREFKWLPGSDDDVDVVSPLDGGYFCPYCAIQAPLDQWLTKAQVALAENIIDIHVVGPMLKDFARDVGRRSPGFLAIGAKADVPDELEPLTETDDMRCVDFACHPAEPLKVLDLWHECDVHCLVCGEVAR